jgi:squalene-hopene/tetraprenyl-beta-curcumene cyclase
LKLASIGSVFSAHSEVLPIESSKVQGEGTDASIKYALSKAVGWLLPRQQPQGFWVGMVDTNSAIEAEWLLCSHIIGISLPGENSVIAELLKRQRSDGSWEIYPGAPDGDVNSTIEVYAALRAKGFSPDRPELVRAREWIRSHDGIRKTRVFTRYWLALIGVWPWDATPNLPPEIIRLPRWFPFSIYNFAQWARATIVPLAVISARRPVQPLPDGSKLEELFPEPYADFDFYGATKKPHLLSLEWLFLKIDRALHAFQTAGLTPLRQTAIRLCLEWVIRHQDADGVWGGIQPPWIYGIMALWNEGYALDHPVIDKALGALSTDWSFERDGGRTIQATVSPVWDTLFCLFALFEAGLTPEDTPEIRQALEWVLAHEIRHPGGDWAMTIGLVEPSGWAFQHANLCYPDMDDTGMALLVLAKLEPIAGDLRPAVRAALDRGLAWALAMQSDNGGWGAFDKNNNKSIICKIPFCNFGEALDPPSVDVTAHVLEAFGALGLRPSHPATSRALAFIKSEQEEDGSWFGRWGVNHIYGTAAVLPALQALGEDMNQDWIRQAVKWVLTKQNSDGGWGESCASYMNAALRGVGPSTPSQTAWALIALLSVPPETNILDAIRCGLNYLLSTQQTDGTWNEKFYTGTGFPGYGSGARTNVDAENFSARLQQGEELSRGFMLGYNLYRHYFPIVALSRARHLFGIQDGTVGGSSVVRQWRAGAPATHDFRSSS